MTAVQDVLVPDIGDFKDVEIIEVNISPGQQVNEDDPLITLESDKASMEVPAPFSGTVQEIKVAVGDKVSEGSLVCTLEAGEASVPQPPSPEGEQETDVEPCRAAPQPALKEEEEQPSPAPKEKPQPAAEAEAPASPPAVAPGAAVDEAGFAKAHASPSVRRFARELGADLGRIAGSGPKGRILKEDVQAFVKGVLTRPPEAAAAPAAAGAGIPPVPVIDFSQFGEVEEVELSRIKKKSGPALHRSWLNVPHVTHHEEADITDIDAYRKELDSAAKEQGYRVTLLAFLMKACVSAMRTYPAFNASLSSDGAKLIMKKYFHLGIAVDTPGGLVVPVFRDVDRKGVIELSKELGETSVRARDGKLGPADMQGACFTISSLGGIGGTAFTPIVNAPEVAILGVTRSKMAPVWDGEKFVPRNMLPLSLSYDHRVIDGALAARFAATLSHLLGDVRRLVL
jgi:pyruvate dehydrogenase E2 component (dihydrolipoamide acetyltransferase)